MLASTGIPLYQQLKQLFIEKIASGEWPAGELIPSEAQLCADYKVSHGPVRQALDLLSAEGLISRKRGKGTWVRSPKFETSSGKFYSFTSLIEQQNMRPSVRILAFDRLPAPTTVARILALPGGDVYRISRLRLANDEPFVLETVYLPCAICPDLTTLDVETVPLYTLLQTRYSIVLLKAKQYFEAVVADDYEAHLLGVPHDAPLLLLQNITCTLGDRPVVLSNAVVRGDRVRYYVELHAQTPAEPTTEIAANHATVA